MGLARVRSRLTHIDPKVNGGGSWDSVYELGSFFSKTTGIDGGVPFERWNTSPYQRVYYQPEVSTVSGEITVDENHGKPPYYIGGPFLNVKVLTGLPSSGKIANGVYLNRSGDKKYVGGFSCPSNSSWGGGFGSIPNAYLSVSNDYLPDVAPYFDRAWHLAKPKIELASLYTFLKESGDITKMLHTTSRGFSSIWDNKYSILANTNPRKASDQFLNEEFGWKPFLSDIKSFYDLWQNADKEFDRIRRMNNQWTRKKVRVSLDSTTETIDEHLPISAFSYGVPCFPVAIPDEFFSSPPFWKVSRVTETSVSASGRFRFYRPEFDDSLPDYSSAWKQAMRYITTSGLRPTPSNIYKAIPWTWLADWISNLGSYIERFSDNLIDEVAAQYFYITVHKHVTYKFDIVLPLAGGTVSLELKREFMSKQRVSADSPYGFRLTWDNLSPRQLAILGALGITHSKP